MDRDQNQNNPTNKAEAVSAEQSRAEEFDVLETTAQIEVKDFSQAPPSQDQDDVVQREKESCGQGSLGQELATASVNDDLGPGFANVDGDVGGSGHNETVVDVIAVPCPGADPVQTWTYDHELFSDISIPCETGSRHSLRSSLRRPRPWVTRKLRNSASIARVFLYRHRVLEAGMTLHSLSEDLLDQVDQIRNGDVGEPARAFSSLSC
jgi:hypothetical protein